MALASPRNTPRIGSATLRLNVGVASAAVCLQGGIAILAAGYARPGRTGQGGSNKLKSADAGTYRAIGVFAESKTGGASDGLVTVDVEAGTFAFDNSAGTEALTAADIGKPCFLVDDCTVSRSSADGTRCLAGVVRTIETNGDIGVEFLTGAEAAGNRRVYLPFAINETDTLAGTSQEIISPVAGEIVSLAVVVQKAITTGGDVTASVDGTAVAGLTCTIADAATKGTVVIDTPTFGDSSLAVAIGSRIQVIPAAAFNTAGAVSGYLEIRY